MNIISDRITTQTVQSTFTSLGIKPPKAVAEAFTRAATLAENARHMSARPGDLEQAVTAALLAGTDPAADPAVQRAVTAQALTNPHLEDAVSSAGLEGIRAACTQHLDGIIASWSKPFDQAVATLTTCHHQLGGIALDDTAAIVQQGGDAAETWAAATAAARSIDHLINGWVNLMTLVRVPVDPRHRSLRLAPLTLQQWQALPPKVTAWEALSAGVTPSLPTVKEYRSRVARIEQALAQPDVIEDRERSHVAGEPVMVNARTGQRVKSRASS